MPRGLTFPTSTRDRISRPPDVVVIASAIPLACDFSWYKECPKLIPINYGGFQSSESIPHTEIWGILRFGDEELVKEAFSQ